MRTLLLLIILLPSTAFASIDTLTFRQVYNFNVGDTFEYRESEAWIDYSTGNVVIGNDTYKRTVVTQKVTSAGGDTITFKYSNLPDEVITNLDSAAVFQYLISPSSLNHSYSFDTSAYSGYISNTFQEQMFEGDTQLRYTIGLGRTFFSGSSIIGGFSRELIYYSNGITTVGTPHYIINNIPKSDFSTPVIFPTVADNQVTVSLSNTNYTSYQLIGIDGRLISSDNLVFGTYTINTSPLSNGIYLVQLSGNNAKPYVSKLVVRH